MTLRRVTVPGGGQFGQSLQDSVSRLTREINESLIDSYGVPTRFITSNYRPTFGELVRCDLRDSAFAITLPSGASSRIGKTVTIANVTAGTNKLTLRPANGSINGETSIEIEKGYFVRQAAFLGPDTSGNDLWLLTTVLDGSATAGIAPFFEWNETDLSQFGSLQQGSGNSQTASVVSSNSLNWIQIDGNCTGGASFATSTAFLPVTSVSPPSANYIVMADCLVILSNGGFATFGVGARHASGTGSGNGYFMGAVSRTGTTTGNVLSADISGATATGIYSLTTNEGLADGDGYHFALGVEGATHMSMFCGKSITTQEGGTYTAAGDFGLYAGGNNSGTNAYTLQFRNLKAYDWPNDGLFI